MKYFDEMTAIESESIRLECLLSLLRTVAHGAENVNKETLVDCIWHMEGTLEDINKKLRTAFNDTWEAINAQPPQKTYNHQPLQEVVNGWIRNSQQTN